MPGKGKSPPRRVVTLETPLLPVQSGLEPSSLAVSAMAKSARRILVVGSANMDLVSRVRRLPRAGETIFSTGLETAPGGKGANQAVAAARLGCRTAMLGSTGDDEFGAQLRASLRAQGVDVGAMRIVKGKPTGTASIAVDRKGQNTVIVSGGANLLLRPKHLDKQHELFSAVDVVLIQLELRLETVEAAMKIAGMMDKPVILDAGPAMELPREILQLATIVSPNETEAEAMTGIAPVDDESACAAAESLRKQGARRVVIKLGARGCLYLDASHLTFSPPFPITAVDATAAGDAFTAGLAAAWNAEAHEGALRFANACGAVAATRKGAQPSLPTLADEQRVLAGRPAEQESFISALEGDVEDESGERLNLPESEDMTMM